jgi:hypothetical protein
MTSSAAQANATLAATTESRRLRRRAVRLRHGQAVALNRGARRGEGEARRVDDPRLAVVAGIDPQLQPSLL